MNKHNRIQLQSQAPEDAAGQINEAKERSIITTKPLNFFQHPSTVLISGPSKCGKTCFTNRILNDDMIKPKPQRLVWAFAEWQQCYTEIRNQHPSIEFIKGIENIPKLNFSANQRNLLILDDLMMEGGSSHILADLFTRTSHHRNLTVIYLVQNLYHRGKSHRDCSINSHYIVLFDSPRDRNQISVLGRQMYPDSNGGRFLRGALADACRIQSHGYLVIDLHTDTPDDLRVKTRIFPGEETLLYKPPSTSD